MTTLEELERIRSKLGWSRSRFADLAGISLKTYESIVQDGEARKIHILAFEMGLLRLRLSGVKVSLPERVASDLRRALMISGK